MQTIDQLKKHATHYGSDGVVDTAVQGGISVDALASLIEFCEKADIAIAKKRKRFVSQRKHRPTYYIDQAKKALGITDEEEN